MKFGIFYELQLPRLWEPDSEPTLSQNVLQVDLVGFRYCDYNNDQIIVTIT